MVQEFSDTALFNLKNYCFENNIEELYIFGSTVTGKGQPGSDIDIMIQISSQNPVSFLKLIEIEDELSKLLNQRVDLVTKKSIEDSNNKYLKDSILREAIQII